jgi:tripartite-type tricarboxylate transporter receptor subunit TctC
LVTFTAVSGRRSSGVVIIKKVHEEIVKIAAQTDMRERLAQLGLDVAVNSPNEFAAVINADIAKWAKVIKDANIKLSE